MFMKHKFKLEIFEAVCWNYGKWFILTVKSTVPLVDQSVVKVWV